MFFIASSYRLKPTMAPKQWGTQGATDIFQARRICCPTNMLCTGNQRPVPTVVKYARGHTTEITSRSTVLNAMPKL